ncbi:MAG: molybdopterin cofactor-binding domain-containing protein [Actinomycetes bacterium]
MSRRVEMLGEALERVADAPLSRRQFMGGVVGGALILAVPFGTGAAEAAGSGGRIGAWIMIGADETVTIICPSTEMGQGVSSALPQIVAEELMVDWSKVKMQLGDASSVFTNKLFGSQGTAGSTSIRAYYEGLRKAGAQAREMLITAAINDRTITGLGGATRSQYVAASGVVKNNSTNKTATYGQLAAAAGSVSVPADPPLLADGAPRLIGQAVKRLDIPSKVDGSAIFGIDIRLPGMKNAAVRLAPKVGQTLGTVSRAPSGVQVVKLKNDAGQFIGVAAITAKTTWDAMRAVRGLSISWVSGPGSSSTDSTIMKANAASLMANGTALTARTTGTAKAVIAAAPTKLSATYSAPYLAHAAMEPLNATAKVVTGQSCEIWAPTQNPSGSVGVAKNLTGLGDSAVVLHPTMVGGAFGRKFETDFVSYAVQVAMAAPGNPVKLTWSREEDFTHDLYRPASLCSFTGGLDSSHKPVGITSKTVSQSIYAGRGWLGPNSVDPSTVEGLLMNGGDEEVAYKLGESQFAEWVLDTGAKVPLGFWRSVGQSYNVFFLESFIDELAHAASADPLAFRKAMLPHGSRDLAVLEALETASGWGTPASGVGRGVAMARGFGGTIAAEVAEVSGSIAGGIKVNKVTVVIDCGTVINPDTVKSQVESGVLQGMSAAMWQEMPFSGGAPSVSNFNRYPMGRLSSSPTINTIIMPANGNPPSGVGEPGLPPIAPAIGNAIAALTGTRLRSLPLLPGTGPAGGDN